MLDVFDNCDLAEMTAGFPHFTIIAYLAALAVNHEGV